MKPYSKYHMLMGKGKNIPSFTKGMLCLTFIDGSDGNSYLISNHCQVSFRLILY